MRTNQARFITACQQLLALGVVLALLVPAANVLSMDVVPAPSATSAYAPDETTARVPVAPVEPKVDEYALEPVATPSPSAKADEPAPAPEKSSAPGKESHDDTEPHVAGGHEGHDHSDGATGRPEGVESVEATVSAPVKGYGAVGVTWSGESRVTEAELALEVRTRVGDEWTDWAPMQFHDEHAPDPDSPDAAGARGGTEALVVGEVDEVEVRADGAGELPEDIQLAVVDPGEATKSREEAPAIETGGTPAGPAAAPDADAAGDEAIELSSAQTVAGKVAAAKPTIYSRAQWGADEKIRDKKSLRYGTISAGFVHHTVNANNYTADQVPGIIRSIYTYHVKSRGWSDVGYNFLVDRFGRIWEGRAGGVDRAVVGAHTLGYNDYAFAMSAIGNFETAKPTEAMVNAYGSLMAWKLGMHGVAAGATRQKVGKGTFPAINGHRDAGSTACPGRHLYDRLGDIRKRAAGLQGKAAPATPPQSAHPTPEPTPTTPPVTYSAPQLDSNLAGSPHPDLVVRRASDKRLMVIPTGGFTQLTKPAVLTKSFSAKTRLVVSRDMTGDGRDDLVSVAADGSVKVRKGNGKGKFSSKVTHSWVGTRKHTLVTPIGDVNGDGRNDLVARDSKGRAVVFLLKRNNKLRKITVGGNWKSFRSMTAVGDITGDGRPDLVARNNKGKLVTVKGKAGNAFSGKVFTPGGLSTYRDVVGGGDFTRDGKADLLARRTDGTLWVLPGLGSGKFDTAIGPVATDKSSTALTVGTTSANGLPELLGRRGKKQVVLRNSGTFELGAAIDSKMAMPNAMQIVNAGDWNGDGKGDIVIQRTSGGLLMRPGKGDGRFGASVKIASGFGNVRNIVAVGDINGDGLPDLIGTVNGVTHFFAGQGTKTMKAGVPAPGLKAPLARLKTPSSYDPGLYDWKISVSDARLAKGTTDLVVREKATGRLHVFENTTSGIGTRRYLGRGLEAYDMAG